jgi:16S rRNA processing protein RimM
MIAIDDCFYLGKITKLFGYKGEVNLFLDTDSPENYYNIQSVLLDIQGELIPFMCDNIKQKNKFNLIVSFQNVNDDEVAALVNSSVYLPITMLPQLKGNKFYYHEVKLFKVVDKIHGEIGYVNDFYDNPGHDIMSVINEDNKEILIPVADQFFEAIDRANKTIFITTPDGLVDLYLS